jgi:hypothetical protein
LPHSAGNIIVREGNGVWFIKSTDPAILKADIIDAILTCIEITGSGFIILILVSASFARTSSPGATKSRQDSNGYENHFYFFHFGIFNGERIVARICAIPRAKGDEWPLIKM